MNQNGFITFIKQQLDSRLPQDRALKYESNGNGIMRCPVHSGGMERTPSFMVTLNPNSNHRIGSCYCYGCHIYIPTWDETAALFGFKTLTAAQSKILDNRKEVKNAKIEIKLPEFGQLRAWPKDVAWRGIPGDVVQKLNGTSIMMGRNPILYFPVTIYGEQIGGINCLMSRKSKSEKAYINTPGEWSSDALFGFDVAMKKPETPLWIVEGPRDTANILAGGSRVVGLIGSAVTKRKINLIKELDPSIILVATDPDESGERASDKLFSAFQKAIPIKKLSIEKGSDPADFSMKKIQKIETRLADLEAA